MSQRNTMHEQILFDCDHTCCVCHDPESEPRHVHHIDGDPRNDQYDNLAVLCAKHHDKATRLGGLGRQLSRDAVAKYRDDWVAQVRSNKRASGWTDKWGYGAEKGSAKTKAIIPSPPFGFSGPWRIGYGTRTARCQHGHLRICIKGPGKKAYTEVISITDPGRFQRDYEAYRSKAVGTFRVKIDAHTEWWWVRVQELR